MESHRLGSDIFEYGKICVGLVFRPRVLTKCDFNVKKFKKALVNGGSNYDSLKASFLCVGAWLLGSWITIFPAQVTSLPPSGTAGNMSVSGLWVRTDTGMAKQFKAFGIKISVDLPI
jgi:hypothetical protein